MPKGQDKEKESAKAPSLKASGISSENERGESDSKSTRPGHKKNVSWGDMSQVSQVSQDTYGITQVADEDISAGSEQRKILNELVIESVKEGSADDVKQLLKVGANPSALDEDSKSLLQITVQKQIDEQKNPETLTKNVKDDNSWVSTQQKRNSPNKGTDEKWVRMAEVILHAGDNGYPQQSRIADPTRKQSETSDSPLQQAQKELPDDDPLRGFLQSVADNRLLYESQKKHPHKVKKLLEGGANPNAVNIDGNSPARVALEELLDSQIEVATLDRQIRRMSQSRRTKQESIDEMQQMSDRRFESSMRKTQETVGVLIEHGANIRQKTAPNRRSPLGYAKEMFDTDSQIVKHMIEKEQEFQEQNRKRPYAERYKESLDKGPDDCEICTTL